MDQSDPHARRVAPSVPCSRAEMLGRVARYRNAAPDRNAFPDLADPARDRSVAYLLSPGETAGPAQIAAPHQFHMAVSALRRGVNPVTHAHPYAEVFMPLDASFRFYWGENLEESLDLAPWDVISVPAGVFRSFECLDRDEGHVLTLFDTGGDPHTGITVPQEMFDKYYSKGWRPTPDNVKAGA